MEGDLRAAIRRIHSITPPPTHPAQMPNYHSLIKAVLAIFRPKRYTSTLFADEYGLKEIKGGATLTPLVIVPLGAGAGASAGASAAAAAPAAGEGQPGAAAGGAAPVVAGGVTAAAAAALGGGAPPSLAAAEAEGGGCASPRAGLSGIRAAGGALNYVQTHKSMAEFQGYSCYMGNYNVVHTLPTPGSGGPAAVHDEQWENAVVKAATASLAMPRAKYIVSQRVEELRRNLRVRTDSV